MSFPVIIIFLVLCLWFVICLPLLELYYLESKLEGELDEKSFNTLIDDYYVESFTGSYLKITHDTFADWLGK